MVFAFALIDALIMCFDVWGFVSESLTASFASVIKDPQFWAGLREVCSAELRTAKYIALFSLEGLILLLKVIIGSASVKKKLRPVEEISRMAMELAGHEGEFNEEKLRALENAIDSITPVDGDALLNSGDRELEGLELAVNGLVKRMRDSYMQQARFVSDASHELRTPIAVIKGYADMLDRWGKSDEKILEESVEAIKTESEHMNYLVEQLLFLARGDSGKTKLNISEFDLFDMMHEVFEESKMIDPEHEYSFKADGPVKVRGDEALLKQTARILTDNASKYTPKGEKIVLSAGTDNAGSFFAVEDSGIGIAKDSLPLLFDRFYRADNSRARDSGGSGLGLAIAKWIVDRHGGYLKVVSAEGVGTKISVIMPKK